MTKEKYKSLLKYYRMGWKLFPTKRKEIELKVSKLKEEFKEPEDIETAAKEIFNV